MTLEPTPKVPPPFWNPLNWLRLLIGVWINQLWYWLNIRPVLGDWQKGRSILFQATLSIYLSSCFLSTFIVIIYALITGTAFTWLGIFYGVSIGIGMAIFLMIAAYFLIAVANRLRGEMNVKLPLETLIPNLLVFFLLLCTWLGIISGLDMIEKYRDSLSPGSSIVLGCIIGISAGLQKGIQTGVMQSWKEIITSFIGFFMLFAFLVYLDTKSPLQLLNVGIVMLVFLLTDHISNRWALRQVPDLKERMRLANPDSALDAQKQ